MGNGEVWSMFQAFIEALTSENRYPDKLEWGVASKRASVKVDLTDEVAAKRKVDIANRLLAHATGDADASHEGTDTG